LPKKQSGKQKMSDERRIAETLIAEALQELSCEMNNNEQRVVLPFREFLGFAHENPKIVFRSIFQSFAEMVESFVGEGHDEYPGDPESINFVKYDTSKLFVEGLDHPFFADRLFANRFIKRVANFRQGAQQNKIYIFVGAPGCGKTTFLNNLLKKFEEYTGTKEGMAFETVWRINENIFGEINKKRTQKIRNKWKFPVQVMIIRLLSSPKTIAPLFLINS